MHLGSGVTRHGVRGFECLLEGAAAVWARHQGLLLILLVCPLVKRLDSISTGWQGHVSDLCWWLRHLAPLTPGLHIFLLLPFLLALRDVNWQTARR